MKKKANKNIATIELEENEEVLYAVTIQKKKEKIRVISKLKNSDIVLLSKGIIENLNKESCIKIVQSINKGMNNEKS